MLENLTVFDKKKLLMEAEIGIVNLRDAASREPQLFIEWQRRSAERSNRTTIHRGRAECANCKLVWRLANLRNRLKYMRDNDNDR